MNVPTDDFLPDLSAQFQEDALQRARLHELVDRLPLGAPTLLAVMDSSAEVVFETWCLSKIAGVYMLEKIKRALL